MNVSIAESRDNAEKTMFMPPDVLECIIGKLDVKSIIRFKTVNRQMHDLPISVMKFAKSVIKGCSMTKFIEQHQIGRIHVEELVVGGGSQVPQQVTADNLAVVGILSNANLGLLRLISEARAITTGTFSPIGVFPNIREVWSLGSLGDVLTAFPNADVVTVCLQNVTTEEIASFRGTRLHLTKCDIPVEIVFHGKELLITDLQHQHNKPITSVNFSQVGTLMYIDQATPQVFGNQKLVTVKGNLDQLIVVGNQAQGRLSMYVIAENVNVLAVSNAGVECSTVGAESVLVCGEMQDFAATQTDNDLYQFYIKTCGNVYPRFESEYVTRKFINSL